LTTPIGPPHSQEEHGTVTTGSPQDKTNDPGVSRRERPTLALVLDP